VNEATRVGSIFSAIFLAVLFMACPGHRLDPASNAPSAPEKQKVPGELQAAMTKIEPFFKPMGKPGPWDWLSSHKEPGQTFEEYINSKPTLPTTERMILYVLPLGKFTPQEKKIVDITSGYLEAFYGLPVEELPRQDLKRPTGSDDLRENPYTHAVQIRSGYILDSLLAPQLPKNAAALIALTNEDLFPDPTMNFVFGQASFENRVGVWSLNRLEKNANRDTFLRRTLKISSHETGHMFSMHHCTKYECVMSGTNHLAETDSRPIDACSECMAKIAWLSGVSPKDRYERLAAFCKKNGLAKEADEFQQKYDAVR
jgi:archaemetzincin